MVNNILEHTVDVYDDCSLVKTLVHDCEEEWNLTGRWKYCVDGHIDITVPFDKHMTHDKVWNTYHEDTVREAHDRKIKEVTIRCKLRVMLTNDDYGRIEREGFIMREITYDISLLSYATFDNKLITLNESDHQVVFKEFFT